MQSRGILEKTDFWNEEHWIQPPDLLIISDINLGNLAFTSLSVSFLIYKMGLKMAIW